MRPTCFECFDGNRCCVVPQPLPHLPELAVPKLLDELEAVAVNLPLVPRVVRQVRRHGLLDLQQKYVLNKYIIGEKKMIKTFATERFKTRYSKQK